MIGAIRSGTGVPPLLDLRASELGRAGAPPFDHLRSGGIFAIRDVPEIHDLAGAIRGLAAVLAGPEGARSVSGLMHNGQVPGLEALSVFYRALRHLRDCRFVACLFSDFFGGLGLPAPVLVDAGYFRIMIPRHYRAARDHPDLFDPAEFGPADPYETERMLQDTKWGDAHRDIDVRHTHFQVNLWFPLHDVGKQQTLILFPEAYRRNISQYQALPGPEEPGQWGYGEPLQVPLRLGDMLMFHSQHVHASPSQALDRNRFTVEIRAAAGCIDDNGRVYRRSFWRLENFRPRDAQPGDLSLRAGQLAQPVPDRPTLEHALAGATAHAVVHRLFRRPHCSLLAGYLHRHDEVLDDAMILDEQGWRKILDRLKQFPRGEDLWLLVARLMLRQKQRNLAAEALDSVQGRTSSYFWALETGRIAIGAGLHDIALSAFAAAGTHAARSDAALDRYSRDMPPPRSPVVLQLLPGCAKRAARKFARLAQRMRRSPSASADPTLFDHRYLWDSSLVRPGSEGRRRLAERVRRMLGPAASSAIGKVVRYIRVR
ncbi:MAG TPA: hypothetical protein VIA19_14770 [Burkholderiales bacterium]